jgi:hypothetical protein
MHSLALLGSLLLLLPMPLPMPLPLPLLLLDLRVVPQASLLPAINRSPNRRIHSSDHRRRHTPVEVSN